MVNLLVTWVKQDPRDKGGFAPSGKDMISFCVRTLEALWRQNCSPLLPVPLGRGLLPDTLGSPILHRDIFTALVFPQCTPLPYLRKSKWGEWQGSLVEKWSPLCPPRCRSLGRLRERGWNKEVRNTRFFNQTHGWRPHRKKERTLSLVTLHQLVLVQCCWIPVFSVRQLNQICLPNYRNFGRNEILLRKCSGNL